MTFDMATLQFAIKLPYKFKRMLMYLKLLYKCFDQLFANFDYLIETILKIVAFKVITHCNEGLNVFITKAETNL